MCDMNPLHNSCDYLHIDKKIYLTQQKSDSGSGYVYIVQGMQANTQTIQTGGLIRTREECFH